MKTSKKLSHQRDVIVRKLIADLSQLDRDLVNGKMTKVPGHVRIVDPGLKGCSHDQSTVARAAAKAEL